MSAKSSGANPHGNGDAKSRHNQHHDGSAGRAYTVEQKAAVIRIKRCAPNAYYEILGLEDVKTTCTEGEIKKAYRKLSLLTHPDKNGYQGADEAFKLVSKAFQVLSDPDKKAKFDRFGGDPDARFQPPSGGGASPYSNYARGGGAQRWEEEISPEEVFRQFFGGGFGGGGPFGGGIFDTGPGFVFNMGGGGPGIRVHQFGGGRPRRRPDTAQAAGSDAPASIGSALSSLLPLLLLFVLPFLSSLFTGSGTPPGPSVTFESNPPFTQARVTNRLKVPYWVNPAEVHEFSKSKWRKLDEVAEQKYIGLLNVKCEYEAQRQLQARQDAQGWFTVDQVKMDEANRMEKPSCRRLRELGVYR